MGRKSIGVLGGFGPRATLQFIHMDLELTLAHRESDPIRMLVEFNPTVNDINSAGAGAGPSAGLQLGFGALGLERQCDALLHG
jgi:aspartate/glutamate racemase